MGNPPAYVFVVRHGARLDQADKKWHLSSPTPYDPPLTYGGWLQTQAVGARIASILRQAEAESDRAAAASNTPRKRRRFRVAIHSSPFLRCVQSSVGISAGLAQEPSTSNPASNSSSVAHSPASELDAPVFPSTTAAPTTTTTAAPTAAPIKTGIHKTPLRLDAFLGEWLNPEYFEAIAHPPGSAQMLGTAKVALLLKENISAYETPRPHASSVSSSHGQLWSSPRLNPASGRSGSMDAAGLENLPAMAGALPRHRADSASSAISQSRSISDTAPLTNDDVYVRPKPNYAISPSGKIPEGYVAHARDACTAVDYQWDTMSQWGDGGSPNEEWVVMHRRFRTGFQKLVDWYSTTENPTALVTKTISPAHETETALADDEELEDVVVIVSHGAGCNAMIGAITRQPVLMDVGVASLTMAVRKNDDPIPLEGSTAAPGGGRVPIDQYYDLKIQASNDHLRNTTTPGSALGRSMSTSSGTGYIAGSAHPRGRVATISSYGATSGGMLGLPDLDLGGSRSNSATANLVSMRKTSNSNTTTNKPFTPPLNTSSAFSGNAGLGLYQAPASASASKGLWTPLSATSRSFEVKSPEEDDDDFPDFDGVRRFGTATVSAAAPESTSTPRTQPEPRSIKSPARLQEISRPASRDGTEVGRANAAGGLWGA
ncbi:phosphoglycerate mutase family protein [Plectosphaerella plurivora]|uniref:Phosphoglycerate mutase family protein n=1 Tax=Plectosphaerella plurivora TaxID=936078 RepID=A0A9P8VB50_9PEZI|nr:phosphoglycerate mutase family protein [Plectosphaerella plurivora]